MAETKELPKEGNKDKLNWWSNLERTLPPPIVHSDPLNYEYYLHKELAGIKEKLEEISGLITAPTHQDASGKYFLFNKIWRKA